MPGQPHSTIDDDTIYKMEAAILEEHRITIRQLAQEVKISVGSVEKLIHDHLHMRKLSARINSSQALLTMRQENKKDFFGRLIIQDETWVHHYDLRLKSSRSNGSMITHHLQRRLASNSQQAW
ncbi:uncharacterized protein LOC115223668 [Octopus sinensis]|uniref:Uncharacterized protein LOC115223668 n=1 Tax=Octopus sinensis TaxID=2607531 RepID=A0A6P7TMF8_9MOLL|nr:uncharacterized protein LOC115223668 [Octopus sinensis]